MKVVDTFQNRLKKAMEINGIKQVELVEKTGLDKTLLNKYLAGVSNARQRKLTILADALNVNEVWLMGYDVPMDRDLNTGNSTKSSKIIPLYEHLVYTNNDIDFQQSTFIENIELHKSLKFIQDTSNIFALRLTDNNIIPLFDIGDVFIIYKTNTFENKHVCLVHLDNQILIRRIVEFKDYIELQILLSFDKPITLTKEDMINRDFKVLGRVIRTEISSIF